MDHLHFMIPLHDSIEGKQVEMVKLLVQCKQAELMKLRSKYPSTELNVVPFIDCIQRETSMPPIVLAARIGCAEILILLLHLGSQWLFQPDHHPLPMITQGCLQLKERCECIDILKAIGSAVIQERHGVFLAVEMAVVTASVPDEKRKEIYDRVYFQPTLTYRLLLAMPLAIS